MADVNNLDFTFGFADVIVDEKWAVQQFADLRPFSNQASHTWETGEQLDVLDQGPAKVGGSLCILLGNVANDFGEIVQRLLRVEESVVHLGKRRRTSSAGTVRPVSASRIPSSMAARVSSSSSSTTGAGFSKSSFFDFAMW